MEIPILVEPVANDGFRAASGEPLRLETEAPTREQAIEQLRQLIARRLESGTELLSLPIDAATHPLARFAGTLRGAPLADSLREAIDEYRDQRDAATTAAT
jgi:CHASE3 domain sensor protein